MRQALAVAALSLLVAAGPAAAAKPKPTPTPTPAHDVVQYVPRYQDPVLKQIEDADAAAKKAADVETAKVREEQKARRDAQEKDAKTLRFDMSGIVKPTSPAAFAQAWHFPPVAQYLTGTCWSFASTSFFESEVFRLTKQRIKLSEIYTVYWEYVEKMKGFVRSRGDSPIAEGSEANAVVRIWKLYGEVPEEAYPGVLSADGRHDHSRLIAQLEALGAWVREHEVWDEERVAAMSRGILDRELGPPPERFTYQGKEHTPRTFVAEVLRLDLDAYVNVISTLSLPFYTSGEYKVPDNWWHDASYRNVPLAEWYEGIKRAVQAGFTVDISGDTSEPGINGFEDAAVVPTFDIPAEYIDQSAREFRFNNHTSTDDHLIHIVGFAQAGGRDWYLVKDSGRSARWGKFEGYYFYREDFVRLKMLAYMVHRDAIPELLAKLR
jgi:bleomycin hydrolase